MSILTYSIDIYSSDRGLVGSIVHAIAALKDEAKWERSFERSHANLVGLPDKQSERLRKVSQHQWIAIGKEL